LGTGVDGAGIFADKQRAGDIVDFAADFLADDDLLRAARRADLLFGGRLDDDALDGQVGGKRPTAVGAFLLHGRRLFLRHVFNDHRRLFQLREKRAGGVVGGLLRVTAIPPVLQAQDLRCQTPTEIGRGKSGPSSPLC
jgi:hypothetical protein